VALVKVQPTLAETPVVGRLAWVLVVQPALLAAVMRAAGLILLELVLAPAEQDYLKE
jgi:hypothetical protein